MKYLIVIKFNLFLIHHSFFQRKKKITMVQIHMYYSLLKASIGLIFTALCAGIIPMRSPKIVITAIAAKRE